MHHCRICIQSHICVKEKVYTICNACVRSIQKTLEIPKIYLEKPNYFLLYPDQICKIILHKLLVVNEPEERRFHQPEEDDEDLKCFACLSWIEDDYIDIGGRGQTVDICKDCFRIAKDVVEEICFKHILEKPANP